MTAHRSAPAPQLEWNAPDWRNLAECLQYDGDLWFPLGDDPAVRGEPGRSQVAAAKAICAVCPARTACLDYAIETRQEYGVWGGLDEDERRALKRKQDRQARALARQGVAS